MAFCQELCNWAFQPPLSYKVGAFPAGGCKQGCFQPWRPDRSDLGGRAGLGDHAAEHSAPIPELPLSCCCKIGEMARKVPVKCAIAGCHRRLKMTLAEREELRRVGREHSAAAGMVCPDHVKDAFNFEFDDIDIDVPLEEFLVEASKETPRWRVMLTPPPGAADGPDSWSTPKRGDRLI